MDEPFFRYKLLIAYDGTQYVGWQVQKNGISIQSLIQKALETALRHPIDLTGSGRTDAGAHALGQTAHFDSNIEFSLSKLRLSLNALLPQDIRILEIERTPPSFHARYSALSKVYHYHLQLDPIQSPFTRLYRYQVFGPFDKEKFLKGAKLLLGTHDFTSFANTKDPPEQDTIRTLHRIEMIEQEGGVRIEFEGDGFLYKMVRNLTGTLLDVAAGKLPLSQLSLILQAKDRSQARAALPSHALFLMKVHYPPFSL